MDLPIYSSESSPRVRYLSKNNSSPFYNSINGHMIDIETQDHLGVTKPRKSFLIKYIKPPKLLMLLKPI